MIGCRLCEKLGRIDDRWLENKRFWRAQMVTKDEMVKCNYCGRLVKPEKPSSRLAILFYLLGLLPGIVYTIRSRRRPATICPYCGLDVYKDYT
jgi:DNA-directed RNA polymerase subunit RPC12/RpoP